MNIFTPFWFSLFTTLGIALPILGGICGGFAYYVDKNLPVKYKTEHEISSQLNNYINPENDNVLWKASEFFVTVSLDQLTDEHQKRISAILLDNLDNKGKRYISLMELAHQIPSPENDTLFKTLVENDRSDPFFVQGYALNYFLKRETNKLNPQIFSLIHHPKYAHSDLIKFLHSSMNLSVLSNSATVTFANNKEIIDELIKVQDDWFKKYEEWIINMNRGDHSFDIDKIIKGTYLAKKIEGVRNKMKASEKKP